MFKVCILWKYSVCQPSCLWSRSKLFYSLLWLMAEMVVNKCRQKISCVEIVLLLNLVTKTQKEAKKVSFLTKSYFGGSASDFGAPPTAPSWGQPWMSLCFLCCIFWCWARGSLCSMSPPLGLLPLCMTWTIQLILENSTCFYYQWFCKQNIDIIFKCR